MQNSNIREIFSYRRCNSKIKIKILSGNFLFLTVPGVMRVATKKGGHNEFSCILDTQKSVVYI